MRAIRVVLAVFLLSTAARGAAGKDVGPASRGEWDSTAGPPAFVDAAIPSPDVVRGVVASQSNLLEIAKGVDSAWLERSALSSVAWRLRGLLGAAADEILTLSLPSPPSRRSAYHLTPARKGESFPGASTYTVWTRWELPLAPILERVPAKQRDEARKALVSAEPAGTPAWIEVASRPEWATA